MAYVPGTMAIVRTCVPMVHTMVPLACWCDQKVGTRVRTPVRTDVLVRVQAHMLARIVVEIRAADIAVELEPQL
jgi:hypothetical protein